MNDAGFILTKNRVLSKVRSLLEDLQAAQLAHVAAHFPGHPALALPPKISRGENYGGLPYLVLDYPRNFTPEVFAVRSLFWWGRFFSITLQLSGHWRQDFLPALREKLPYLCEAGYFLGVSDDPWQHHFEPDNYQPLRQLEDGEAKMGERPQLKLAIYWPLGDGSGAVERWLEQWQMLVHACLDGKKG